MRIGAYQFAVSGNIYDNYNQIEKEIYNRALLFQPNTKNISYDKRVLWGWDNDNFTKGNSDGIFEMDGIVFGIRICFEIRFPEFFRELYKKNTDVNVIFVVV